MKKLLVNRLNDDYLRILRYVKPYQASFLVALLCMTLYGASEGITPFLVKFILDKVFNSNNSSYLYLFPVILILVAVLRAIADFGQQFLISKVGHLVIKDIRNELCRKLLALGHEYYLRHSPGDILSRIGSDVSLVRILLIDSIATIIRDFIKIVALLCVAFYLDPFLAVISFIVLPVGLIPIFKFGKRIRKLSRRGQDSLGNLASIVAEFINGSRVVTIFGAQNYELNRFSKENEELTHAFIKSEKARALGSPVNEVLASFVISGVLLYGGFSVMNGSRTQGDFIAFILSVFLLYDPFKKLGRIHNTIQQGMAGANRIFDVLDSSISISSPQIPVALPTSHTINFSNVSYKYPSKNEYALQKIDLTIPEGSKVAIVGFSGSGKSTLIDLIARFMDPSEGLITIGNVDIKKLELEKLRSIISMVGQYTFLFNDTVYNNILYGNRNATKEEVENAAQQANAVEFIQTLPRGYETVLGEGGYSLSGGERQRLSIARAILKNAPIVLLDEATASLDNRAEKLVQDALESLEQNRTSITIAHRLTSIIKSDIICVMSAGAIVEVGTHQELLSLQKEYYKLHSGTVEKTLPLVL
jgi:ATP-binding cassette, subfamily B, bacterial MsbA